MHFLTKQFLVAGLTLLFTAPLSGIAAAGGHLASEHIQITQPWSRALPAVSTNGAAYMHVKNGATSLWNFPAIVTNNGAASAATRPD